MTYSKYIFFVFFCLFLNTSFAGVQVDNYILSSWKGGFCNEFKIKNPDPIDITNWELQFKIHGNTTILSSRGWELINNWSNFSFTSLEWNSVIKAWDENILLWLCVTSNQTISDINFINHTIQNSDIEKIWNGRVKNYTDCSKFKTDSSCENGNNKNECRWKNNSCVWIKAACKFWSENLVYNGWFEWYEESSIIVKWWQKLLRFIGLLSSLPWWNSVNGEYKIRSNSELPAADGKNFLELLSSDSIFQNINSQIDKEYLLTFNTLGKDTLRIKWDGNIIHEYAWTWAWERHEYILPGRNGQAKLELQNSKTYTKSLELLDEKTFDGCNRLWSMNECNNPNLWGQCIWTQNMCLLKKDFPHSYTCGSVNTPWVINITNKDISLSTIWNIIHCWINNTSAWNTILTGNGNDYLTIKTWDKYTFDLWWGNNIFYHKVYDSQLVRSTIKWWDGFDKVIFEDEKKEMFHISWDCSISCSISLLPNILKPWQSDRFRQITFEKIDYIKFSNGETLFKTPQNIENPYSILKTWIDNIEIYDINCMTNLDELLALITPEFINLLADNTCNYISQSISDSIKQELVKKLITGESYADIEKYFWESITDTSKFYTIKNEAGKILGSELNKYTQTQKETFFNTLPPLVNEKIEQCFYNSISNQVKKEVDMVNYLRNNITSCSMSGNTIKLSFFHHYSHNK